MMTGEKISIVIVTYNAGATIRQAIKSVLDQRYQPLELLIIDGKSTDNTVDIIQEYRRQLGYWLSEPDKGIYDAMNKGIAAASGHWILFLGADDLLCDNILNELFAAPASNATDIIYGKIRISNTRKTMGAPTGFEELVAQNIPHQAIFYSKQVLTLFNGYDTRYKILADYHLNLALFEDDTIRKKFVDNTIAIFSAKGVSNRTIDYPFFSEKLNCLITKHGIASTDKRLAKYYFFTGVALVLKKAYRAGISNLVHSIIYSERRGYYLLLVIDFILSLAGMRKRYKYV